MQSERFSFTALVLESAENSVSKLWFIDSFVRERHYSNRAFKFISVSSPENCRYRRISLSEISPIRARHYAKWAIYFIRVSLQ